VGAKDESPSWHVYIVRCSDRTLYTGVAKDLAARVAAHNAGRGAKYTRSRRPVRIVYREPAADRGQALKREHEIKRMTRAAKRALCAAQPASAAALDAARDSVRARRPALRRRRVASAAAPRADRVP
jgi:putative endonuclease